MAWHKVQSLPFNFLLSPLLDGLLKPDTFFLFFFLSLHTLTWHTFLLSFAHRSQNLLLFTLLLLSNHSIPTCPQHTHTHCLSLTKKSWRRCQECVCCPFHTDSDAILGPWGGQSHGTWHSTTPLLACLVFLSWRCSGHPERELVQLLLIPSLYIRTP